MASDSSSLSSDEEIYKIVQVLRPRIFRERNNPMELFDEFEFRKRFRLSKTLVSNLAHVLDDRIKPVTMRSYSISSLLQILVCLRFLATGTFQIMVGDDIHIHRSTACRIISKVLPQIANLRKKYIKMPSSAEQIAETIINFQAIAGFPKVIGCIDGTHVRIQSPGGNNGELYRCRKGFFSYNVQIVCDNKLKILDIVARWPGSTHDSTVFNNSLLKIEMQNNFDNCFLLGDSAYPASNYLLTPLAHTNTNAEKRYQASHISTRNTVERTIGVWKRRFAAISQQLRVKKKTALAAIVASAVLHNILIDDGLLPNEEPLTCEDTHTEENHHQINENAIAVRNAIIQEYFID